MQSLSRSSNDAVTAAKSNSSFPEVVTNKMIFKSTTVMGGSEVEQGKHSTVAGNDGNAVADVQVGGFATNCDISRSCFHIF